MSHLETQLQKKGLSMTMFGGDVKAATQTLDQIEKGQESKQPRRHNKPNQPR